jgi:hypothetical protein
LSLGNFIGGPYTLVHGSTPVSVGLLQDGIRITTEFSLAPFSGDQYGDSVLGAFYRGGNTFVSFGGLEYTSMLPSVFQQSAGTPGRMGLVGREIESQFAQPVVASAVSGTPAATSPATVTASKAGMTGQANWEMASRLRTLSVQMQLFPYTASGNVVWYTTSSPG